MTKRIRAATAAALAAEGPDRRMLLTSGAAAALIASTAQALPAGDPDAALWSLRDELSAQQQEVDAALERKGPIEERYYARCPSYPDVRSWPGTFASFTAETARITAEREKIAREEGYDVAEQHEDETSAANAAIVERIAATRARTLAGLSFKARVSADWDHDNPALTRSIMDDLTTLAAA